MTERAVLKAKEAFIKEHLQGPNPVQGVGIGMSKSGHYCLNVYILEDEQDQINLPEKFQGFEVVSKPSGPIVAQ